MIILKRSRFLSILGIPTGGPDSGSSANLVVYSVLEKIPLVHPSIAPRNKMSSRKRFLDDIWFAWLGTEPQFNQFKVVLNEVGSEYGEMEAWCSLQVEKCENQNQLEYPLNPVIFELLAKMRFFK